MSRDLPNCTMFDLYRDFLLTSELASSNRRTKERFVNMQRAVIYVIIT